MRKLITVFICIALALMFTGCSKKVSEAKCGEISALIRADTKDKIINGAAVLAGGLNDNYFEYSYGLADFDGKYPMTCDTVLDIASVTKVACTITALLICRSRGLVDFDAPFTDYIKDFKPVLRNVPTVRQLANHTSGFVDVDGEKQRRYFAEDGRKIMSNMLLIPPPIEAGKKLKYSCWNYILLSMIVERVSGMKFDEFCRKEIFVPLKMSSSSLGRPKADIPEHLLARTMGTAKAGEISDFVAMRVYRDGLACGNAGMFTSAKDFAKLMRCYLREGKTEDGKELFSKKSFAEILPNGGEKIAGARNFGWSYWEVGMDESQFGGLLTHSGWSGQTVCMNVKTGRFAIVFTTRVGDYDRAKRDRFKIVSLLLKN